MKNLFIIVLFALSLNASEYFAKLEPYESITISAEVSGKVVFLDKNIEYSNVVGKKNILKLDTSDEDIYLEYLKNSLRIQKDILKINKISYKNKANVKQISIYDKNQEKLTYYNSKQNVEDILKNIKTYENQRLKKQFFVKDKYVGKIEVKKDEYVNVGDTLYTLYDFSKTKLEIYIREDELKDLTKKSIFIDGKKSDYKIEKISKVRDKYRVSTYKVIITKENTTKDINFGKVVQVEVRW